MSYKFSGPLNKTIATGWRDNNNSSYYYPITNHYKINSQLSLQITEKLSPYLRLSFGKVEGKIFRIVMIIFLKLKALVKVLI